MKKRNLRRNEAKEEWKKAKKQNKGKHISFTEFWRKNYVKEK